MFSKGVGAIDVGATFGRINDPDRKGEMKPLDSFNYDMATAQFSVSSPDCIGILTHSVINCLLSRKNTYHISPDIRTGCFEGLPELIRQETICCSIVPQTNDISTFSKDTLLSEVGYFALV